MTMALEISEDILKNTTQCMDNFSCLNIGKGCLCSAEDYAGGNQIFVKGDSPSRTSCDYCLPFEYSFICNCPTRNEIYRRYRT